jgi:hypothetical protein
MKCIPAVPAQDVPWEDLPDGAFTLLIATGPRFSDKGIIGINYKCPCGCGTIGELRFVRFGETPQSPTYLWDGNFDEPTVTPIIRHIVAGQIHWEGVLQRGEWIISAFQTIATDPGSPSQPRI